MLVYVFPKGEELFAAGRETGREGNGKDRLDYLVEGP